MYNRYVQPLCTTVMYNRYVQPLCTQQLVLIVLFRRLSVVLVGLELMSFVAAHLYIWGGGTLTGRILAQFTVCTYTQGPSPEISLLNRFVNVCLEEIVWFTSPQI